jgi:prepilin peptidase CpaA
MIAMVVFVVAVGVFVAMAACTDYRMHRIPNYITVPTAILGLAYHALAPAGVGVWLSLAGFAVGFALLFVPWLLGGSGMGDVKLLAALGAWLGPKWLLVAFALSMIIASTLALTMLLWGMLRKGMWRTKRKFSGGLRTTTDQKAAGRQTRRVLPFAVPLALATWVVLVWLVNKGTL